MNPKKDKSSKRIGYPIVVLFCLAFLPVMLGSCVEESPGGCLHYTVMARLTDRNGAVLPDSMAENTPAYVFGNGRFVQKVSADRNGYYGIRLSGCDEVWMAVLGNGHIGGLNPEAIGRGAPDSTTAVRLTDLALLQDSLIHRHLFYGKLELSDGSSEETSRAACGDSLDISLYDRLARFRIVLENVRRLYGEGNYSVTVSGLHTSFTYAGKVTGETVDFTPELERCGEDAYFSGMVSTLPSVSGPGLSITVKRDGKEIGHTDTDEQGNPLSVDEGTETVVVVRMSLNALLKVRVMPWSDYLAQGVGL